MLCMALRRAHISFWTDWENIGAGVDTTISVLKHFLKSPLNHKPEIEIDLSQGTSHNGLCMASVSAIPNRWSERGEHPISQMHPSVLYESSDMRTCIKFLTYQP
jgi:hypothetical protein